MGLDITSTDDTQYNPVFLKILEDIPGGVTIMTDRIPAATYELKAGSLLHSIIGTLGSTLASTGQYRLVKTAKVAIGMATEAVMTLAIYTNHEFKAGELIGKQGAITACSIYSITKGATTDHLVLVDGGSLGLGGTGCGVGIVLEEKSGLTATSQKFAATVLLRQTVQVRSTDLTTLYNVSGGAVVRGTVNESELPFFVTDDDKTALTDRMRWA